MSPKQCVVVFVILCTVCSITLYNRFIKIFNQEGYERQIR